MLAYDYLVRFRRNFADDGVFALCERDGVWLANCHHRHAFTITAPGHAVQAEQWAEYAVLEPAHDQLFEIIGTNVTVHESTNIRRPPGNAAHGDIQPGRDLGAQHFEARADIS